MTKNLLKKLNLGLLFISALPVFAIAIYWFRFSPIGVFIIFSTATAFYLMIALIHHFREKTLIFEIVIEYVLIAILALLILESLIF